MNISLDLETIRTLVAPTGDALVSALYLNSYRRFVVSLHHLHEKFLAESPDLARQTSFSRAFDFLTASPKSAQKAVLAHPSVRFWTETAWSLVLRQSHLRFPEMHAQMHLEEFGKVALAAAIKSGQGDFECVIWTDANGRVALPGAGIFLETARPVAFQRLKVRARGGALNAVAIDKTGEHDLEICQRSVPTVAGGFELNDLDMDLRLPGQGSFEFAQLRPEDIIKWQSTLEHAWGWISECSPALAEELSMSVRAIIPIKSAAVDVHASASFREAPGLIALSWTPDCSVMVEALVHEYHHQKLNALFKLDKLIVGPSASAIYYSPWRNDPRPLTGILHGAYAFQAVMQFFMSLFAAGIPLLNEARLRQRMYLVKGQVQTALAVLREEARLSPLGKALVEAMADSIEGYNVMLPESEKSIQGRLDTLQAEHRARWEAENRARLDNAVITRTFKEEADYALTEHERRALDWLGMDSSLDATALQWWMSQPDPLLNAIISAFHERDINELKRILAEADSGKSLLLDLIGAHLAYVSSEYERAAILYESCLRHEPADANFWRYFAFSLRHLARGQDSNLILTNLGRLSRASYILSPESSRISDPVEARLENVKRTLNQQPQL